MQFHIVEGNLYLIVMARRACQIFPNKNAGSGLLAHLDNCVLIIEMSVVSFI